VERRPCPPAASNPHRHWSAAAVRHRKKKNVEREEMVVEIKE
jgi:hypothetical protein